MDRLRRPLSAGVNSGVNRPRRIWREWAKRPWIRSKEVVTMPGQKPDDKVADETNDF